MNKSKPPAKTINTVTRPSISQSYLKAVPNDAVEGYQERIETGIDWDTLEEANRYHRKICFRPDLPQVSFSKALASKMDHSYLSGFLHEESPLTLEDNDEFVVPTKIWDNEKFASKSGQVMFMSKNSITEKLHMIPKKAVKYNNRNLIKKELKTVTILRVNDSKMTHLDEELKTFKCLQCLNLCGNYISKLDSTVLPSRLILLELSTNAIEDVDHFVDDLPHSLEYLGLARNFLVAGVLDGLSRLPHLLTTLDLGDNDIYELNEVLEPLAYLPSLMSLILAGNPCSVCAAYAREVLTKLPRLNWLDSREVHHTDFRYEMETHPDDLLSAYFHFTVIRVISVPPPPKLEKGFIQTYHVEFELPLLDSQRRMFLMFRNNDSLTEMLPPPEDEFLPPLDSYNSSKKSSVIVSKEIGGEGVSVETDPYAALEPINNREVIHYTKFETPKVQWNWIMTFPDPTVRIFCPDLIALRNTFRTVITAKLVYTQISPQSSPSAKKTLKTVVMELPPAEMRVVLATIKLKLTTPDWSQPYQHFHWDDSFENDEAMHWRDGDLTVLHYGTATSSAKQSETARVSIPSNLTCHFACGIDTLPLPTEFSKADKK